MGSDKKLEREREKKLNAPILAADRRAAGARAEQAAGALEVVAAEPAEQEVTIAAERISNERRRATGERGAAVREKRRGKKRIVFLQKLSRSLAFFSSTSTLFV